MNKYTLIIFLLACVSVGISLIIVKLRSSNKQITKAGNVKEYKFLDGEITSTLELETIEEITQEIGGKEKKINNDFRITKSVIVINSNFTI